MEEEIDLDLMRYELDDFGYIANVYFGCYTGSCMGYTGEIPEGYETLIDWHDTQVTERKLSAWKVVAGNLVFDEDRYNDLEKEYEKQDEENTIATHKYVNDKLKVSNSYVTDELAVEKAGTSLITISDTGNYSLPELKVTSDTVKNFTVISSNKNLLRVEAASTTINGVEITNNYDGTITLDGTSTSGIDIDLGGSSANTSMLFLVKDNLEYSISGLTSNVSLSLYAYDGTDRTLVIKGGNQSFTLNSSAIVTQAVIHIPSGIAFKEVVLKPQIEIGVATDFVEHEETKAVGILYDNECFIYDLNSYEEKTVIMIDEEVTASVKYYRYQYLNEKIAELEVTEEEVKSTLTEIDKTVEGQNQKISEVTQRVGELNSKISEIADVTTSRDSMDAKVILENINESEPIYIKIHPTTEHISILYPSNDLYPRDDLFFKTKTLRFKNIETNEIIDYELPVDLFYYDVDVYDEFILDYEMKSCAVNKRVELDQDGIAYELETPTIIECEYPKIALASGDYEVSLVGYKNAYIFVRLMAANLYTTQYATKVELKSEINQTTENINMSVDEKLKGYSTTEEMHSEIDINSQEIRAEVNKKIGEEEIIAKINLAVEEGQGIINITGNQVTIDSDNFNLDAYGNIKAKSGEIAGLIMTKTSHGSYLLKDYDTNDATLQSGLFVPSARNGDYPFMYAGSPAGGSMDDSNLLIYHNGLVKAKWFEVNGESGYLKTIYDNGQTSMLFSKDGIFRYLSNGNYWDYQGILYENGAPYCTGIMLNDSQRFQINDDLHDVPIAFFQRGISDGNSIIWFYGNCYIDKNRDNTGYEIATIDMLASDEKLKTNIKECTIKSLPIIRKIDFKQFDWNKEESGKEGHIDIGIIAQDLEKINSNYVTKSKKVTDKGETEILSIDILNLVNTGLKAIQELDKKIEKRDKIIEFLAEKLNCKDEVLEMLKEGE